MSAPGDEDVRVTEAPGVPASPAEIGPEAVARIAARARRIARQRLRRALDGQAAATPAAQRPGELDDELLDRIAGEEAESADGALLRVSVVHAVSLELELELEQAHDHPAVARAYERLTGSAAADPAPRQRSAGPFRGPALLLEAVHMFGIETLEPGDRDIELRFAEAGIDVRKPSTAETIGRLRWPEVRSVAVQRPRRGLPGRRRSAMLTAGTDRGEVTFELPGLSDNEITEHLEPLIARNLADVDGADVD